MRPPNRAASFIGINIRAHLSCVDMLEKVVLSWVPSPLTIAIMATAIPAAIKPYSIAVAAD